MVTIRNIGEAILSHIENNNKTPAKYIEDLIQKHKISLEELSNVEMYKKELYKTKYENVRIQNKMIYDLYLKERNDLINEWKNEKSLSKLFDIINFKRPEIKDVEDIYTYQNINLNKNKNTVILTENTIKKDFNVKTSKITKTKDCPDGKILNPKTGRCITDKNLKKVIDIQDIKSDKSDIDNKPDIVTKTKDCPDGKILNPKTGRCITDKNLKKVIDIQVTNEIQSDVSDKPDILIKPDIDVNTNKNIKTKDCPEGKILNPKTGRCITDKTIKKKTLSQQENELEIKPDLVIDNDIKVIKIKKIKDCPDGKIINPKTGRCITDKTIKKL